MIEYHKITQEFGNKDMYQTFIFRINKTPETITLLDIWVITRLNDHLTKMRIDIKGYLEQYVSINDDNKLTDEEVLDLHDMFDDVMSTELKQELMLDFMDNLVEEIQNHEVERLLVASEVALSTHPLQTIQEIVDARIQNNLRKES